MEGVLEVTVGYAGGNEVMTPTRILTLTLTLTFYVGVADL